MVLYQVQCNWLIKCIASLTLSARFDSEFTSKSFADARFNRLICTNKKMYVDVGRICMPSICGCLLYKGAPPTCPLSDWRHNPWSFPSILGGYLRLETCQVDNGAQGIRSQSDFAGGKKHKKIKNNGMNKRSQMTTRCRIDVCLGRFRCAACEGP